jgi:hypothetical protein
MPCLPQRRLGRLLVETAQFRGNRPGQARTSRTEGTLFTLLSWLITCQSVGSDQPGKQTTCSTGRGIALQCIIIHVGFCTHCHRDINETQGLSGFEPKPGIRGACSVVPYCIIDKGLGLVTVASCGIDGSVC